MHTRRRPTHPRRSPSQLDALEPRRLFALSNGAGASSTVTGSEYQSVDATVAIPGGYAVGGTFADGTDFGHGLPKVTPNGYSDIFLSVVKGSSASLLTIGGGFSDTGKPTFKDDRADYTGIPERTQDTTYIFPLSGQAAKLDEYVTKMAMGPDGKLYVAVAFRRPTSLNTLDKNATTLTPGKQFNDKFFDSAVLRYTIDGANLKLDRTLQIGGPFNDVIYDMAFASDNGDLLVSGSFGRDCDFDPTSGTNIYNPDGGNDAFVARYGSKNRLVWMRQFGGDSSNTDELEAAYGIAVSGNNVLVGGAFAGKAEFDRRDRLDDSGQDHGVKRVRITAQDKTDGFTVKLNATSGAFDWVRTQGGDNFDAVRDVAVAPDGGVYNYGFFEDKADLDPSATSEQTFQAADEGNAADNTHKDADLFITRINGDGSTGWVKPISGDARKLIGSISSTSNGNLTVAGSFAGTIDADPSKGKHNLTSTETGIHDRNGNRNFAFAGFVATYSAKGVFRSSTQIDAQREQDLFLIDATRTTAGKLLIGGRYLGGVVVASEDLRVTTQKKPTGREDGFAILI